MAVKVDSYKWFKYDGRHLIFPTGHPDHELSLFKGEIYGYRKIGVHHYVIDKSNPNIRFELKEKDALRILKVSAGWSGLVRKVPVKGGIGGRDKPPAAVKDTGQLHFLEIDSSNLKEAVYDKKEKVLYVGFHTSPAKWAYLNVSKKEAKDLEESPSQGRYFIYMIREVKAQHRVTRMPTQAEPIPEQEPDAAPPPVTKPKKSQTAKQAVKDLPKPVVAPATKPPRRR